MRSTRSRFRLMTAAVAAAMTFALVPALGATTAAASVQAISAPRIVWQTCPAGSAAAQAGGFTCSSVLVPLDYQDPAGPQIKLAVVRHAATGPVRRGVIFINPGGPGGAGTFQIPAWIGFMPSVLLRDYDIVSWDPRGVGDSTAAQCFPSSAAEAAFLGPYADFPVTTSQQAGFIRRWDAFGKICAARNGTLLQHVSTADTARDLDLLRRALGQPELDYIGLSYGTYLGATYANLFPGHAGRMVLDGNIAPTAWSNGGRPNASLSLSMRIGSTTWVAKTLTAFLSICGQRSTQQCAFSAGSPAATTAKWDALLTRLRQGPITVGGTAVTYTEIVTDVSDALERRPATRLPGDGRQHPGLVRRGRSAPGNLGRTQQQGGYQPGSRAACARGGTKLRRARAGSRGRVRRRSQPSRQRLPRPAATRVPQRRRRYQPAGPVGG